MDAQHNTPDTRSVTRIVRFVLVGLSGVLVNEGILILLHGVLQLPLAISSVIAVESSIMSNFVLNALWTWHYDFHGSFARIVKSCLRYHVVTGIAALTANVLLLLALVHLLGMDYRIANFIGIVVAAVINFTGMHLWVFQR